LIGVEALRIAGWTTQIAHRWDVALHADDQVRGTLDVRIRVCRRPLAWFHAVLPGLVRPRLDGDLFRLRPAWALADLLKCERRRPKWSAWFGGLFPDDVEPMETTDADRQDWRAACAAFGLDPQAEARWLIAGGSGARL
jgi:hypothetical protein